MHDASSVIWHIVGQRVMAFYEVMSTVWSDILMSDFHIVVSVRTTLLMVEPRR